MAQAILMGGAVVTVLYGGGSWIEDRYAKDEKLTLVEMRLDQKIEGDQLSRLQERMWKLEDRYGPRAQKGPDTAREEYRRLQDEKDFLERRVNSMDDRMRSNRSSRDMVR